MIYSKMRCHIKNLCEIYSQNMRGLATTIIFFFFFEKIHVIYSLLSLEHTITTSKKVDNHNISLIIEKYIETGITSSQNIR